MLGEVLPVVVDLHVALAAAGGLLLQYRYYHIEGPVLPDDGVGALEHP